MATSSSTGPSRRSHTKSRKGCKTCKKRHIRCDETFPQCQNCTKHQVKCDYQEAASTEAARRDSAGGDVPIPGLYWSAEIESIISLWQRTGECSLGGLTIDLVAQNQVYSKSDLHLLYFAITSTFSTETNNFTTLTSSAHLFLDAAKSQSSLVHAILAYTASALAWENQTVGSKRLAYHHGGLALERLPVAVSRLNRENADAVLAASVLLARQANDWRSWYQIMGGIRTIADAMKSWRWVSPCARTLLEHQPMRWPVADVDESPTGPEFCPRYVNTLTRIRATLDGMLPYFFSKKRESDWLMQLADYISRLLAVSPAQTPQEQFNHLYAYRKWLLFLPPWLLQHCTGGEYNPLTLTLLAYFYSTAFELEPLYPAVAPEFTTSLCFRPLDEILRAFDVFAQQETAALPSDLSTALDLMRHPREVFAAYKARLVEHEAAMRFTFLPQSADLFASFQDALSMTPPPPGYDLLGSLDANLDSALYNPASFERRSPGMVRHIGELARYTSDESSFSTSSEQRALSVDSREGYAPLGVNTTFPEARASSYTNLRASERPGFARAGSDMDGSGSIHDILYFSEDQR